MPATATTKPYNEAHKSLRGWCIWWVHSGCIVKLYRVFTLHCINLDTATDNKIGSPRAIIKMAYQCGMIDDADGWPELLEARNLLAHTYSDEQALAVIRKLKTDYVKLFDVLKEAIGERWME